MTHIRFYTLSLAIVVALAFVLVKVYHNSLNGALIYSASGTNAAAVKSLLARGADPKAKDKEGRTALMGAWNITIAQELLNKGADVDSKDHSGKTALMNAAECGWTNIVRALLNRGADVNAKDGNSMTALMRAAYMGHTDIAKMLLARGADVNVRDRSGHTAHLYIGDNDVIWTTRGDTALMHAAQWGRTDTVKVLLTRGADANAKNRNGETAISIASRGGYTAIIQLLKQAGAKE